MNANSPEKKLLDEIRESYSKTYPNCIFTLVNHIDRLKEELEQKDAQIVVKDEALEEYADRSNWGWDENDDVCCVGWKVAQAALSPQTDKAAENE